MSSTARFVTVLTLVGAFVLMGCGGDSSDSQQEDATPEVIQEPEFVRMQFSKNTPEADLQAVIDDVISFLNSNDIDGMLEKYIPANDLQTLRASGGLVRVAKRYGMFRNDMLTALREALSLKPEINADTTRVSYPVQNAPAELVFVKIGGKWYFPPM